MSSVASRSRHPSHRVIPAQAGASAGDLARKTDVPTGAAMTLLPYNMIL